MAYDDEDLTAAIDAGVLTADQADRFRELAAERKKTILPDEENFRLVTSFNDIFVTIACLLVLIAAHSMTAQWGGVVVSVLAWCIAEYFTRIRRMALPSLILLLAFVFGAYDAGHRLMGDGEITSLQIIPGLLALLAAGLHWWRFAVPITIAAGTAALVATLFALIFRFVEEPNFWVLLLLFLCGIAVLSFAMWWDIQDRERVTKRADVAFWLHLLAAPMIAHPAFTALISLGSEQSVVTAVGILLLYGVVAVISISLDRRALMVSALFYVLYAVYKIFTLAGGTDISVSMTSLVIGASLLGLSMFWQPSRRLLVGLYPPGVRAYLPELGARP